MKYIKDDQRDQKRLEKILKKMAKGPHVAVGILQDSPVSDNFTMIDLATVHEFGSKDGCIPQRSFMRSTCDGKKAAHANFITKLQGMVVDGALSIKKALAQLGEVVSKDMVQTINRGLEPELKSATIRRKKGGSKPLIDTGRLKGSITYEVRGGS